MDDLYLSELTDEQAGQAMRQAAHVALNGGGWEPVGHDTADRMMCDLLGISHEASIRAARGDNGVLLAGLERSAEILPHPEEHDDG